MEFEMTLRVGKLWRCHKESFLSNRFLITGEIRIAVEDGVRWWVKPKSKIMIPNNCSVSRWSGRQMLLAQYTAREFEVIGLIS